MYLAPQICLIKETDLLIQSEIICNVDWAAVYYFWAFFYTKAVAFGNNYVHLKAKIKN